MYYLFGVHAQVSFFENHGFGRLYTVKSGLAELEDFENLKEKPYESQVNKKVPWIFKVLFLERIFQNRVNL